MSAEEKCSICKFPFIKDEYYPDGYCSDFCERTDEKQKSEFLNLKDGEWGSYPCSKCGVWINDEFNSDSCCCGDCWPRIKEEALKRRLKEVEQVFAILKEDIAFYSDPGRLTESESRVVVGALTNILSRLETSRAGMDVDALVKEYKLGGVRK